MRFCHPFTATLASVAAAAALIALRAAPADAGRIRDNPVRGTAQDGADDLTESHLAEPPPETPGATQGAGGKI
jgi:hypothetical protein